MPSVPPAAMAPADSRRVVARLDHHRTGHDAEHGHGRADDAGRHGEDRRRQDDREVERAAHRREQASKRAEQALHQSRLLGHVAHEDEQGHGGKDLVLHRAPDLQVGEIEGLRPAEADTAEDEGEEQQGERDREADEDHGDHAEQHDRRRGFRWGSCWSDLDLLVLDEEFAGSCSPQALQQLGDALQEQHRARERDDGAERPDDRLPGAGVGSLVDRPSSRGNRPSSSK